MTRCRSPILTPSYYMPSRWDSSRERRKRIFGGVLVAESLGDFRYLKSNRQCVRIGEIQDPQTRLSRRYGFAPNASAYRSQILALRPVGDATCIDLCSR